MIITKTKQQRNKYNLNSKCKNKYKIEYKNASTHAYRIEYYSIKLNHVTYVNKKLVLKINRKDQKCSKYSGVDILCKLLTQLESVNGSQSIDMVIQYNNNGYTVLDTFKVHLTSLAMTQGLKISQWAEKLKKAEKVQLKQHI